MKTRLSKEETKEFKDKIMAKLIEQSLFKEFKYSKSYSGIVKKTKFGYQRLSMYFHWKSYSLEKKEFAFEIMHIGYDVRFNVLHKWFEKYGVNTLNIQRTAYSICQTTSRMEEFQSYPRTYTFVYSGEDFDENLAKMVKDMVEVATYIFDKHSSLEGLYEELVVPCLEGKKKLPNVGAEWIFRYLTLTKLVDNKNYDKLKALILGRTVWMDKELNIVQYKDKLDEIFEYLEALELEMPPEFPQL